MKRAYCSIVLTCITLLFLLVPEHAWAQMLTCSGGSSSGDLYADQGCDDGNYDGIDHIFSMIICQFVEIINRVMSDVYCSIQYTMVSTLKAVFTVYIAVFGAQLLMGSVQLNAKEFMVRMLKIAGVWMFVSQTYFGIGIAFNFFINVSVYGIGWVWEGVNVDMARNPYNIGMGDGTGVMPLFGFFDQMIYDVVTGPFTQAHSAVIGFFFVMWYLAPTIFMLAAYWLWLSFTIIVRTLISFLISIAAFAFLISLSPIFLSFMLFTVTYDFFENWLKYMMSYTIQIIVIFAVIALWLASIKVFVAFFDELALVIFPYNSVWMEGAPKSDPVSTWGVCPLDYTNGTLGPEVKCQDATFDPTNPQDAKKMIPAARIPSQGEFVYYLVYRLLTLIIICYAFDTLAREAPYLAKSLAGPEYVPILGQGYGFSRYGIVNKAPEWTKRFGGGVRDLDKSLGISNAAKGAVQNMADKYGARMAEMLGKR